MAKTRSKKIEEPVEGPIIIDAEKNLIFQTEEEIFKYFEKEIETIEKEYDSHHKKDDISEEDLSDFESFLSALLEEPNEVWVEESRFIFPVYTYFANFVGDEGEFTYIALTYVSENVPTFLFLHFPTRDADMIAWFKKGTRIYSSEDTVEAIDALAEGDVLAKGLYEAMLKIRTESDIPEEKFDEYLEFRDETIEEADEIWRSTDLSGNVLVSFIKDHSENEEDLHYIAITIEDSQSESHYVLFSFPTKDKSLVERYRHGELLNTETIVQEDSH